MKKYSTEIERRELVRKNDTGEDEHSLSGPSMEIRPLNTAKLVRWKKSLARKNCNDRSIPLIAERGTKFQVLSHIAYTKTQVEIEASVPIVIDEDSPEPQIGASSHGMQTVLPFLEEAPMAFVDDCASYNGKLPGDWTVWNQSRILDSPRLDTLFSTLKICGVEIPDEEIPTLSLAPAEASYEQENQYISNEDIRDLHNPFRTSKRQDFWLDSVSLEHFGHGHQQQQQFFSAKDADTQHQLFPRAIESFVNPLNEIYPFARPHVTIVQSAGPRFGNLHTAHLEYEERLQKLQRVLPLTHTGVMYLMERLSGIYAGQENFKTCLVFRRKLNAAKKELYGDNDPRTLHSYISLNQVLANISPVKAMASHRPLHEALMRDFPSDDDIVRQSTMFMSCLCQDLGQIDDAEKFSRQVLQMCLNAFGPRHRETLRAIGSLACTLQNKGVLRQSESLLRIAIQLHHETRGHSEKEAIWNIRALASIFQSQWKLQESVGLFRRACEHSRAEYGDDHPQTLRSISRLAGSLWRQGNMSESSDLLQKSIPRMIERLGEGDVNTQWAMSELAYLLETAAKYQEAAGYYKRAFEGRIQSLGIEDTRTVWACIGLGMCYERQGLFKEASTLYESTIMEIKTVCSEDHPSIQRIQQHSGRGGGRRRAG
jgi:tetratricopeptide (TPR) repeat protein